MHAQGPLVLLVEDEPDIRRFLALSLRLAGCRVWEAGNRAEALRALGGPEPVSLLVCDVCLRGDRGRDVAQALAERQPGLPTLFLSGLPYPGAVADGLVPAGCHYLAKPFGPDALRGKLAELLPLGGRRS
jgi:CheY-like chemotaxis protein